MAQRRDSNAGSKKRSCKWCSNTAERDWWLNSNIASSHHCVVPSIN